MPLKPGPPPDRRKRLLAFAEDLVGELEALDLDTIDGEFYWRWCRTDLQISLEQMCLGIRPVGSYPTDSGRRRNEDDAYTGVIEPEAAFDYLREGLRFARDVMTVTDEAGQLYPRIVWQRLLEGERVAMRAAEAAIHVDASEATTEPPLLQLKVFSGAWTGRDVEEEVRRVISGTRYGSFEAPAGLRDDLSLRLRFTLGDEERARSEAFADDPPRFPYILVEVPLPLPPEQVIAREYEALVREQRAWHLELHGSGSRQDKEVAIRTWTVGLLVRIGIAVNDAIGDVHIHLDLGDIIQARFGQDRKRLLERVPEAEPYVFSRAAPMENTRVIGHDALVEPGSSVAIPQPPESDSGLYP